MPLTQVKAAKLFDQFENELNSRPHAKLRIVQITFEMTEFHRATVCNVDSATLAKCHMAKPSIV